MSLPPVTIQIKRKATDEPVDFLRVHEANGKRQRRATDFVFTRQQASITTSTLSTLGHAPKGLRQIKDIRRATSSQTLGSSYEKIANNIGGTNAEDQVSNVAQSVRVEAGTVEDLEAINAAVPHTSRQRQFHISRSHNLSVPRSTVSNDKIRKKGQLTLFVERRHRTTLSHERHTPVLSKEQAQFASQQSRPQKKPGLSSRLYIPKDLSVSKQPVKSTPIPQAILNPLDIESSQLAADLQVFTLAEIGRRDAEINADYNESSVLDISSVKQLKPKETRFKPKAPALRYAERHPEPRQASRLPANTTIFPDNSSASMDIDQPVTHQDHDTPTPLDADGDYIIDTYICVPVEMLDARGASHDKQNIGLLILESQSDIEEFYGEDEGSDSEEGDEADEDENAEDYYTADYPDEEVASDDEYGYNAYKYRNRNADDADDSTDREEESGHEDEYL